MRLEGSYTFQVPRQKVWDALHNIDVLASILPGTEKLEPADEENKYTAVMNIKVGTIVGVYKGTVELSQVNEPESYHMDVTGQGTPGFVNGLADIFLEVVDDNTTIMHYAGDAEAGGRLASVGFRLIENAAKSIVRQSLDGLAQIIEARAVADIIDPSNVLVSGAAMRAIEAGTAGRANDIQPLVKKHDLTKIDPEKWYPQQKFVDFLYDVVQQYGGLDATAIGLEMAARYVLPYGVTSVVEALAALDETYHVSHENESEESGWRFEQLDDGTYLLIAYDPYPPDFSYGVVYGLIQRFAAGDTFAVEMQQNDIGLWQYIVRPMG